MAKTTTQKRIERTIEKMINIANHYELQYGSPMGEDYLDVITVMYDPKTDLLEKQSFIKGGVNHYKSKEERLEILETYKRNLSRILKIKIKIVYLARYFL